MRIAFKQILLAAILLTLVCVRASFAEFAALKAADDKIATISAAVDARVTQWRYQTKDVPNGQDPQLNDSGWKVFQADHYRWGNGPVCWLRTRVIIPREILGVPVSGTNVVFTCGVDDDGTVYLNGKKIMDFRWDGGRVVLTENARPGDTFDIAIRNRNTQGPGQLLSAALQYENLAPLFAPLAQFTKNYYIARNAFDLVNEKDQGQYAGIMSKAVLAINLDALRSGDNAAFQESVKSASLKLQETGSYVKDFTIHLVGHAHIDMNWLWLWPETVDVCKNTFTSAANLMNEFPDMKFGQSQPETYLIIKEKYPELFARIKEMVKRGQWDPTTASTWVEGDTNMSSGEAIIRSILYGKRFIMKEFGVEPVVCWEPDNFGHAWTLPQILAKSGIKYYYNMRCGPGTPLYWWQSPDGSRVLGFSWGSYNSNTDPNDMLRVASGFYKATGLRDFMRPYGVGDHGGGPTRAMLKTALELQARKDYPVVKFDTVTNYMDQVASSGHQFPVFNTELNTIFEGCYTAHSDIKRWNRESENLLPTAEKFSAICGAYSSADFEKSWRNTCFNEFHDILCGTAIHGSYDYSRQLFRKAMTQGRAALNKSLNTLESRINTKGTGTPIVVFNSLSWTRTDAVNLASPIASGDVHIADSTGAVYPAQVSRGKLYFTAHNVPALGYKVFWVRKGKAPASGCVRVDTMAMANQFLQVHLDSASGAISDIYDKANNRSVLPRGAKADLLQILLEKAQGMSAWKWGQILGTQDLTKGAKVSLIDAGPAKVTYAIELSYNKSNFKQAITLYDDLPRVDIHLTADWQEGVDGDNPIPALKAAFPVALNNPKATFEIPFGSIERERDGKEVPAQKWIDLSEPGYGVSLLNDCKYGFDVKDNTMRISLLRASRKPDPQPDKGIHEMTYSIYPHKGDWRAAGTARRGYEINEPLIARVVQPHSGKLPALYSFVSIVEPNFIITAFKKAEDDNSYILRFYETNGQPGKATIKVSTPAKYYVETDLLERPIGKKMPVKGGKFVVSVGRNEIKTYKLMLK